jgi:hypothetical protein
MYPEAQVASANFPSAQYQGSTDRETIASIFTDIDNHLDRLAKVSMLISQIADGIGGPVPQEALKDAPPDGPPRSLIDMVRRKQRILNRLVSDCERGLTRIQQHIG